MLVSPEWKHDFLLLQSRKKKPATDVQEKKEESSVGTKKTARVFFLFPRKEGGDLIPKVRQKKKKTQTLYRQRKKREGRGKRPSSNNPR